MVGAFVVAAVAGLVVLFFYVGAAVSARHQAQSAADLAALAAAQSLVRGDVDPCWEAELIAGHMDVVVASCEPEGGDVVVSVRVGVDLGPLGSRDAGASARAGPVE